MEWNIGRFNVFEILGIGGMRRIPYDEIVLFKSFIVIDDNVGNDF